MILDDMLKALEKLPSVETFVSWSVAPKENAWHIQGEWENYTVAHEDFWEKVLPLIDKFDPAENVSPLFHIRIRNADLDEDLRRQIGRAIGKAFGVPEYFL